jgi:hypothetical protein
VRLGGQGAATPEADALARRSADMQIDHVPADGGGGGGIAPAGGLVAKADSINGNANLTLRSMCQPKK